ncbi:hypothetical protein LH704_11785 [Burkholderia cenocepacia]|uniref:hypothetical protein n=1 Tax=Burkholderia cenocepacia TaxID=95486 RepID=UPI001F34D0C3|nr:hypothetical protein [Burkholderia cenocepacia]MCF1367337.1 hypothetical protein [Burkholderia cenocepacia]MCF1384870.1 hypothetical protein [Burkholderia cenocepacia]
MHKSVPLEIEFSKFGDTVRVVGTGVEITNRRLCETPAAVCAARAEQLRALAILLSGEGFEVFDCLDTGLKANLMLLVNDLASNIANLTALVVEVEVTRNAAAEVCHD